MIKGRVEVPVSAYKPLFKPTHPIWVIGYLEEPYRMIIGGYFDDIGETLKLWPSGKLGYFHGVDAPGPSEGYTLEEWPPYKQPPERMVHITLDLAERFEEFLLELDPLEYPLEKLLPELREAIDEQQRL